MHPPTSGPRLTRDQLAADVLSVAPALLGCVIEHAGVAVRLTEVEAYAGSNDPGSHAFRGPTPRTQVMFGEAGHLYTYFSYGMHTCANIVCGPAGEASAVLLRAGEVVAGQELARARRAGPSGRAVTDRDLARGPARLTVALDIGLVLGGTDLVADDAPVILRAPGPVFAAPVVRTGPRVGVSGAGGDGTAYPWRFWVDGDPTVSTYRPALPRGRRRGT